MTVVINGVEIIVGEFNRVEIEGNRVYVIPDPLYPDNYWDKILPLKITVDTEIVEDKN